MHLGEVYNHPITMEDRELYRRISGIETPGRVESVDLQLTSREVPIYLAHEDRPAWPCTECGAPCKLYDHQPARQWRHLDACQYRTILHAEPPRTQCPAHGVRVVKLPWAEPLPAQVRQSEGSGRPAGAQLG
jgi:transposase